MKASKLISLILHPIFMPLLALHLSLIILPEINFAIKNIRLVYLIVFFSTIIFPLIFILILIKLGSVDSLEMKNHKERVLPLFNTTISMFVGYFFLKNILIYCPILLAEFLGAIIIISIASIISNFWKISLHMLAIGGVLGVFISIQILYKTITPFIIVFLFLSGLLAYARLNEKAHNKAQIYVGFLIGFVVELIILLNY